MKTIQSILLAALVIGSSIALADDAEDSAKFNVLKQNVLNAATQETQIISQFQTCVTAAQKKSDLRECREVKKEAMEKLHDLVDD